MIKTKRDHYLTSIIIALEAGSLLEFGRILESGNTMHSFGINNILRIAVYSVPLFFLIFALLKMEWKSEEALFYEYKKKFRLRFFLLIWIGIFLCWIPTFLAYYPTIWAYDVFSQVPAITGGIPSTHHPLLHTLLLETIVQIGHTENDYEFGMSLLSLLQMLAMSGIFSYGIEITYIWGSSKFFRTILFCFFAFFPTNSILSISMTKDVLFSGCFLVCCLKLYDMADQTDIFYHSWRKILSFIVFTCLMLSMRNQAIYVFIAMIITGIFLFPPPKRKRFIIICVSGIIAFLLLQICLFKGMNANSGSSKEAYSVPMQCLVGTAILHPELIPEYGKGELLFDLVPRDSFDENLKNDFKSSIADPVKSKWPNKFNERALIKTWIEYGIKYPLDYMTIWGDLTLGAWYPFDKTHANIYNGNRQGYLLTDFKIIQGMNQERPESKWPQLERIYEKIATDNIHQTIPCVSLIFAPATYCWIMLFLLVLAIYHRKFTELLPLCGLFFYWGTVLLGPTAIIRYIYPIIVTVPFILSRIKIPEQLPNNRIEA